MFQNDLSEEESKFQKEEKGYGKIRIRTVDFGKVETQGEWLTHSPFELEVREKLAGVPSAADLLIQAEEERRKRKKVRQKLSRLLLKAGLSIRQKDCFRALFVSGLSAGDAAVKMGVTERRIRRIRKSIMDRLQATAKR